MSSIAGLRAAAVCLLLALAAAATPAAERPPETLAETDTIDSVLAALRNKNCPSVVERLNRGLKSAYPGVFMLAGLLYEEGWCLKPNWERAEQMYLRAHEVGHGGGLLRLVSGLAVPGRDPAAALWWAQQTKGLALPAVCRLTGAVAHDPDLFVATIKLWAPSRLAGCVYTAGVMATVTGDAEYPQVALDFAMVGQVKMDFTPSSAQIAWQTVELQALQIPGLVSGEIARDRDSHKVKGAFEKHLREVGDRALARYLRPGGIPAEWRQSVLFEFKLR